MISIRAQLWKKPGVSGCWEILLSNFDITNWKEVTVFWPFVQHFKIPHLDVFLAYLVLLAFLFHLPKGNPFITYICCALLFSPVPSPQDSMFLTISNFYTPCFYSAIEKTFFLPMLLWKSLWIILVLFTFCIVVRLCDTDFCCKRFSLSSNSESKSLLVDT